ncbi:MAG: peptidoglycan DD-metalloendopeptidase family protein [Caldilineales bacterium]
MALGWVLLAAPAAQAQPPPPRLVVQPGDTLATLAEAHATTAETLAAANNLAPNTSVSPGQVVAAPPATQPLVPVEAQPRDTLRRIARRQGVSLAQVQALNALPADALLVPGQDVLIPAPFAVALPSGPIRAITADPPLARQGQTVRLQITLAADQPLSVTVGLPPQQVPLYPTDAHTLQGLVALNAFTEPGAVWLDIAWQQPGETISHTLRWPLPVAEAGYPTYDIVLPDDKGDLLAPELVQAELDRMIALWSQISTAQLWYGAFLRPVTREFLTSAPYGQRRSYNSGPVNSFHAGQDFAAPEGAAVIAPAAGRVVLAEALPVRGNAVLLDHGRGVFTGYWHLVDLAVAAGQSVQPGDLLGHVGTTGLSTGNHLHWELRVNGFAVDPMQWLVVP